MSITSNIAPICKINDILDRSKVNGTLYVVSDADGTVEPLVYADNEINNSDRVRSHFAKRTGVKFTSVRCCRLKNYKG